MADYGAQDTSTTTLGANQFPISEAWTPNSGFSAVEGDTQTTDSGNKKSAPIRVAVKDGSDITQGASTDANTANSVMGRLTKIRDLLLSILSFNLVDSAGTNKASVSAAGAVKVDNSGVTQPVSGTFWQATQPVSGTFWQATQPVSGTVSITSNSAVNVAQVNGVATTTGNGISGTGVQRITLASDSTGQVTLAAGSNVIGALTANQSINAAQVSGTAIDTNSGVKSAGTQRVVLATDQPALTNALLTNPQAIASGGATPSHTISAASTNATSLKASAGVVWGLDISNTNAAARYVKLYDKASAPTVGTDTPIKTIQVPANGTYARAFPVGLQFSNGIAWAATGAMANADTTAIGAGDLSIDIDYK